LNEVSGAELKGDTAPVAIIAQASGRSCAKESTMLSCRRRGGREYRFPPTPNMGLTWRYRAGHPRRRDVPRERCFALMNDRAQQWPLRSS
jgi:hypothetical protein